MTNKQIEETIKYFEGCIEGYINVYEVFHLIPDKTLEAFKNALIALRYYQEHEGNEPLTLEELNQIVDKCVWWDWVDGVCLCKKGYVISDYGTFSKEFVISHGKAYKDKPKEDVT